MGVSQLRTLLNKKALEEDVLFTIPHPFLPPRFREICENRNMLLLLDRDMTIHVRWEGERMSEHHPLTKGGARRLIREVLRKARDYRRELEVYARFLESKAGEPFDDDRYECGRLFKPAPPAEIETPEVKEISAVVKLGPRQIGFCVGGSSPMPEWDW